MRYSIYMVLFMSLYFISGLFFKVALPLIDSLKVDISDSAVDAFTPVDPSLIRKEEIGCPLFGCSNMPKLLFQLFSFLLLGDSPIVQSVMIWIRDQMAGIDYRSIFSSSFELGKSFLGQWCCLRSRVFDVWYEEDIGLFLALQLLLFRCFFAEKPPRLIE